MYIDVLTRETNQKERAYWKKRILGTGSPKFDKVAASRKEDFELPDAWRNLIGNRKVILYNTGLAAMLKCEDSYLKKLRSVLDTFQKQDDVVLWWRPHPLLQATFQSMHPELLAEYEQIVTQYRHDAWGIYDDTSELNRAIAWSDAYYGDGSSVVQLYQKTGKPIMIQNAEFVA